MGNRTAAIAALTLAAASASATTFSFSSDRNTDGPTLASLQAGSVIDGRPFDLGGQVIVDFFYDMDEDGPGGPAIIPASFEFNAVITNYTAVPVGGDFLHSWTLEGQYKFTELTTGQTFFTATFANALMSNFSDSATLLSKSGSLQSNKPADAALAFTTGGALTGVDLTALQNFSFSMSALRSAANGGRVAIAADGRFLSPWKSESSWSARAVPAPGAAALLAFGGLIVARRRR
ncbi:MAG: hypothetical protein IT436_11215 [Phycisphaerales bacterium]|nr:hypothetical protein [Phycisphaerales bacterium]